MKRIIHNLLLTEDRQLPLTTLCVKTGLRKEDILSVCTSAKYSNFFVIQEGDVLRYMPPFGILNRHTLIRALESAFPSGVPTKVLDCCYEFAFSDVNSLVYEKKVHRIRFGKSNDGVLFAPPPYSAIDLSSLWKANLDVHMRINPIFSPASRTVDISAPALCNAEDLILDAVLQDVLSQYG